MGIKVAPTAWQNLQEVCVCLCLLHTFSYYYCSQSLSGFFFAKCDIITINPVVKHMNLVDMADGMATYLESQSETHPVYMCRLLSSALSHFLVRSSQGATSSFCFTFLPI